MNKNKWEAFKHTHHKHGRHFMNQHTDAHYKNFKRYQKALKLIPLIFILINIGIFYLLYKLSQLNLPIFILIFIFTMVGIREISGLIFSIRMRKKIMDPIETLKVGVDQISRGNYGFTIDDYPHNMIGGLIESFNKMSLELKAAREIEERYEINRKELIAGISHDLKTPITSILGYVEGINEGIADTPDKMKQYMDIIYFNASYTNRLIDDLFLFSKLDINQMEYQFNTINVLDYFTDIFIEKKLQIEEKGATIDFQCVVDDTMTLDLDGKMIYRVISNILNNALKYCDKDTPEIHIHLSELEGEGKGIKIEVRDNGPGIEATQLENIFQVFYRADASRNKDVGGTGLGLSIAKQLIEAHGGQIWAESEIGEGTTIGFTLMNG
ncbi:sensor histidine kinase [Vallitalea okinawensis]|uniref:sensor histidine kinase n=1 Tax=Vallitalea okinawensis TaxID=2078660 RepID=UPI000CFB6BBD|nr:HAMP domain-containing sensor histidine kinase [Vallitalea okinawensis]